jgi:signal transduction histidine kinase
VSLAYEKENTTIRVRDSGPGIPEKDLPHVFERFYRGKQFDSEYSGVGLGLAMVRETVDAHGGEVKVENRKSGGVEFTITLPGSLRVKE